MLVITLEPYLYVSMPLHKPWNSSILPILELAEWERILYAVMRSWDSPSRHLSTWEQIGTKSSGAELKAIGVCVGTTLCLLAVTGCVRTLRLMCFLGSWGSLGPLALLCRLSCFPALLSWRQLTHKLVALLDFPGSGYHLSRSSRL